MFRPSHLLVGVLALGAAGCNDDTSGNFVHTFDFVVVRFVNATDTPITVTNTGSDVTVITKNLVFGGQAPCLAVDVTDPSTLTFTNASTGQLLPVTLTLPVGGNFTIIAFADTTNVVRFAALNNSFTPAPNDAGLRFFNGASRAGALVMNGNGVPLTPGIGFGAASNFASVVAAPTTITFTSVATTVLNAGTLTLLAGATSTIVVGPPAAGVAPLRSFTVAGC
jgi:hypothetical protein